MDNKSFEQAVTNNYKILSTNLKNRTTDFSEINFWEGVKGKDLSATKIASKMYDIIGCCATGVLPSVEKIGADGYFVRDNNTTSEWEVKVCSVSKTSIFLGKRGGLYHSTLEGRFEKDRRSAITSKFAGAFDANMSASTLSSKARNTALVLFDEDDNYVIDVYMMDGKTVLEQLKYRRNNNTLTLKLSCFQEYGDSLEGDALPGIIGWDAWEALVTTHCESNHQYTYQ
jgi:hypothetical protein